jgi:cytochrome b subunit of formate dehydrogenase
LHIAQVGNEPPGVRWVRAVYLALIPLVIGLMWLHNFGDWIRKVVQRRVRAERPSPDTETGESVSDIRMLPWERVQHALLVVSFALLAWTGFALKYPDQWWGQPLLQWESRFPVRSWIHRWAAVVFVLAGAIHVVSLACSRRLRNHWQELLPRRGDIRDALRGFAYSLGLRSAPPFRARHSYVEKTEYWALVWGAAVMALTGWMLWSNNLMLRWLPKAALDIATAVHFYEAVLATLAIVVWHLYFVIFDPDVYPMDLAWLTGKSSRAERKDP